MQQKHIIFLILIFHFFIAKNIYSSTVSGVISGSDSTVLSYSNVYVKNSTYGVTADFNGNYFIELKAGTYTLVFNYLGYETQEKEITIGNNEKITLNVTLKLSDVQIFAVEVVANKVDKAKKIMNFAREKRRYYANSVDNFQCNTYVKTSIEKESKQKIEDSTNNNKDFETYLKKENLNLIEYLAIIYYKKPNKTKEIITAYHNYADEKPMLERSISIEYGDGDIAPQQHNRDNPYIFYKNNMSGNFDFYDNMLNFPSLCEQPLVSPIAFNSNLYYKFQFETSFLEDSVKINKINVIPFNNYSALFYGNIYIEDKTWALVSVDLSINEKVLTLYENFNIIQNYKKINDSIYVPIRTEITYTIKGRKEKIFGNSKIIRNNYIINQEISNKIFNNEIISYQKDAFDKDSTYWVSNRPITLKTKELTFIKQTDSLQEYYLSDVYLDKQDSIFNRITWWTPFTGIGRKNHYKGYEIYLGGLLEQVAPFGIGGYRHRLPLYYYQLFNNDMYWESRIFVDYGFRNGDVKGKLGLGLTYFPKKFVRTFIEFGDYYELINYYAAVEQVFSRSNFVRSKSFGISQRMEVINGLFAELSYNYSNQLPINDLQQDNWSDFLFGEINKPIDFEQYIKSEVKLELKYVIGQKYVIKKNRKIIIGTDFPEILFTYKRGIPNLFNSEVDFEYLEFGAKDIMQLARFGESRWQIKIGIFTNKTNLRVLEHKYFRGSDLYFFSDPTNSMQLLGLVMSTNNQFLQANYIHHFTNILNKVPLFKRLKLSLAAGVGTLNIPAQDFYHIEMFAGIEKVFRIKKQLFRFGTYAVTADNSISAANIRIKFGITYFDSYKNKWGF